MAVQREVDVLNSRFRAQEIVDVYRYDTITVAAGTSRAQFFRTLGTKADHLADFEGDKALVKEGRLFEVRFIIAQVIRDDTGTTEHDNLDLEQFFDQGSWKWDVANVRFDEDTLRRISGGLQWRPVGLDTSAGAAGAPTAAYPGDGRHDNVRMYSIPKVIPGGREVDFEVTWQNAGGSPNPVNYDLQIIMYGIELVPLQELGRA